MVLILLGTSLKECSYPAFKFLKSLWECEIGIEKWQLTSKFHLVTWLATDWQA